MMRGTGSAHLWRRLGGLIALCLSNPTHAGDAVSLAGSFNGWNPADGAYRLRETAAGAELVRSWTCGVYEFKFTFNGSWARHWGAVGDGRLAQPGSNIRLVIPQSATYAIRLDQAAARWALERVAPAQPTARFVVHGDGAGLACVLLDGSLSEPRAGRRIARYEWNVTPVRAGRFHLRPESADPSPRAVLCALEPGRYLVALTVDDGDTSVAARQTVELGTGWEVIPDHSRGEARTALLPLEPGLWGRVFSDRRRALIPTVIPAADERRGRVLRITDPVETRLDVPLLVRFDARPVPRSAPPGPRPDPDDADETDSGWRITVTDGGFHEFLFDPRAVSLPQGLVVERVEWVGPFDGGDAGARPMIADRAARTDEPLVYRCIVELPDGVHHYRFRVNGFCDLEDPRADPQLRRPDGTGGFLSGVRVGDDAATFGPPAPGRVRREAVHFDPSRPEYWQCVTPGMADVRVRTLAADVESASLLLTTTQPALPLVRSESRDGYDYWTARVTIASPPDALRIVLADGDDRAELTPRTGGGRWETCRVGFETPDWARTAVWYQVFPERFRNGDPANDPPRTVPWTHAWNKPYRPDAARPDESAAHRHGYRERGTFFEFIFDRRYGGDIQGIQEKLPYLRSLGVNALYLNPVFAAESLHKYDAADYRHIDDHFGVKDSRLKLTGETPDPATWQWSESDRVFLAFLAEAHRQGFRVIIDGVFNHTGREFWAFQDILKNGRKSPYADWFDVSRWKPFEYPAWDRPNGALPRLKHDEARGLSEPVRQHLFAVTRRWMDPDGDGDPSDGIDGWRLDVPGDINFNFWRDWCALVRSINPRAYLVGEIWTEARDWLRGDLFDAVMNYEFARCSQRFFVDRQKALTPAAFDAALRRMLSWYPPQVNLVQQNLFDSHDTDRVASMLFNPDLEYDQANRLQDNGPNYRAGRPPPQCFERLKLMVTFQMTFLGAPMIYYGDEVGMFGADDPICRKPMLWEDLLPYDDPDERILPDLLAHYRRMIAIRNSLPCLQLGRYDALLKDGRARVFAFARTLNAQAAVVVLNNDERPHELAIPVPWTDATPLVRLDDASLTDLVEPAAAGERPRVRVRGTDASLVIRDGKLHGLRLPPKAGAVICRADELRR